MLYEIIIIFFIQKFGTNNLDGWLCHGKGNDSGFRGIRHHVKPLKKALIVGLVYFIIIIQY